MGFPWKKWIPGVFNKGQITELVKGGYIRVPETKWDWDSIDESSIDLTLSSEGYALPGGSIKPSESESYGVFIRKEGFAKLEKNASEEFLMKARRTYVFKLREKLAVDIAKAGIHGQETAKSSVGRMDVLARLIVDGMNQYESFSPARLLGASFPGEMYLEITPMTFNVRVKEGVRLTQLRLFYGDPINLEIKGPELFETVFKGPGRRDGSLSVNLENATAGKLPVAAFRAKFQKSNAEDFLPLFEEKSQALKPEPWKYWKFIKVDRASRLRIKAGAFYLLRSKELIALRGGVAVYCRASDETIGEMRIHYAGFVHPLFGLHRRDNQQGTPLIFEVRGHQVDVNLTDGEKMANLTFYRMSNDCSEKRKPSQRNRKKKKSDYGSQSLKISNFFADWPPRLTVEKDGTVQPALRNKQ